MRLDWKRWWVNFKYPSVNTPNRSPEPDARGSESNALGGEQRPDKSDEGGGLSPLRRQKNIWAGAARRAINTYGDAKRRLSQSESLGLSQVDRLSLEEQGNEALRTYQEAKGYEYLIELDTREAQAEIVYQMRMQVVENVPPPGVKETFKQRVKDDHQKIIAAIAVDRQAAKTKLTAETDEAKKTLELVARGNGAELDGLDQMAQTSEGGSASFQQEERLGDDTAVGGNPARQWHRLLATERGNWTRRHREELQQKLEEQKAHLDVEHQQQLAELRQKLEAQERGLTLEHGRGINLLQTQLEELRQKLEEQKALQLKMEEERDRLTAQSKAHEAELKRLAEERYRIPTEVATLTQRLSDQLEQLKESGVPFVEDVLAPFELRDHDELRTLQALGALVSRVEESFRSSQSRNNDLMEEIDKVDEAVTTAIVDRTGRVWPLVVLDFCREIAQRESSFAVEAQVREAVVRGLIQKIRDLCQIKS